MTAWHSAEVWNAVADELRTHRSRGLAGLVSTAPSNKIIDGDSHRLSNPPLDTDRSNGD